MNHGLPSLESFWTFIGVRSIFGTINRVMLDDNMSCSSLWKSILLESYSIYSFNHVLSTFESCSIYCCSHVQSSVIVLFNLLLVSLS
jgi:hypothetical protein